MKVIDSSALSKYVNREANWKEVRKHLEEGCMTLDLAIKEVGNSIWKRVSRGELDPDTAMSLFKDLVILKPFKTASQEDLLDVKALETAIRQGITIYDALFIQFSKELNLPLLTSDKRQAEASQKTGVETTYVE
ncbi:MAG: type II toxin-antitoxin system VapC family toxin [Candidatus Bathyarchaeia archaeon]|nr:type II toxin-antitoxin system VapC family toxin [Candidatus Bathyarchaeota archaeon]